MSKTTLRFAWLCLLTAMMGLHAAAETPAAWRFSNGAEFPGAKGSLDADDSGVMHLRYDFTGGGAYVGAFQDLDPPLTLKSVTFRVKKPAEAQMTLRVVDSTDQLLQEPLVFEHDEWQSVNVDMQAFDLHFGGANDGVVHFPIKAVGILLEAVSLAAPTGEVLLSDAKCNVSGGGAALQAGEFRGTYHVANIEPPMRILGFHGGSYSLDFGRSDSAFLAGNQSLFGSPRSITVALRGGRPGNIIKMVLGSHFQTFTRTLGALDGGEKQFTVEMPPGNGWEHSGGEDDGEVRLPLRISQLLIERDKGPAERTVVDLLGVTCETILPGDEAVSGTARLNWGNDTAVCAITGWNVLDEDQVGTLTVTLRNWEGNELKRHSQEWTLKARGELNREKFSFELPGNHNFLEALYAFKSEHTQFETRACWTRPLEGAGDTTLRPELPWGMGVYLYRYGDPTQGPSEMDKAATMAQAAGVKWSREEFSWARTEPTQGQFDFHFYDAVVDTARKHGISVYGLLSYWSTWTEPYTEKGIDDFCVWAKALVGHFKDRVKYWEVYNEPNIFFWQGPKELYPVLVKKCYAAIKEADPEAKVLACSTAGIDLKFIDLCLAAEAPFDILTVHPYRAFLSDGGFIKEMQRVAERVEHRPVWITEMGWSTQVAGKDERAQASLLSRSYLSAVASGACQNIGWYDFRDDANDPFYNEANFGVLRNDLTPKPAYRALATVCGTLNSGTPHLREDFGKGILAMEMGDSTAVWSPLKSFKLPCKMEGDARVVNLMGEPVTIEGGALTLLRGQPLFVTGGKLSAAGPPEPMEDQFGDSGILQF